MIPVYKEMLNNMELREVVSMHTCYGKMRISDKTRKIIQQKVLGLGLLGVGLAGCFIMPEDCGACILACLMGIGRTISKHTGEN